MCGFSVSYTQNDSENSMLESLRSIEHRGPDSRGIHKANLLNGYSCTLGHVRLSIIDLTAAGHQPMVSRSGSIAMVFNGEIYNFVELRDRLGGIDLRGNSDSEVFLELYSMYGPECFSLLRGMFAASFLHLDTGRLVVVRDQIGIKPVYYFRKSQSFYFSSEIKGLRAFGLMPRISKSDLFEFLSCGFVFEPNTGIEGVLKVKPGSYVVVEGNSIVERSYFNLHNATSQAKFNSESIQTAVHAQSVADVKLGVFFSGGLDSSVISMNTVAENFYVKYQDHVKSDSKATDFYYAEKVSACLGRNITLTEFPHDSSDKSALLSSVEEVSVGTEELISDYTFSASRHLSRLAREKGYKVMLSGMGGDEVFIGYPRYRLFIGAWKWKIFGWLLKIPWIYALAVKFPHFEKKVDRLLAYLKEPDFPIAYSHLLGYFKSEELIALWKAGDIEEYARRFSDKCQGLLEGFESDHPLVRAVILDAFGFLSHNLMVADKSSMLEGIELRVPLLDQDLYVGFIGSLRSEPKSRVYGKRPIVQELKKVLPRSLWKRRKVGFNPPLDPFISNLGKGVITQVLSDSKLRDVINISEVINIVEQHFSNKCNNTYKIWQFLYLATWLSDKDCGAIE